MANNYDPYEGTTGGTTGGTTAATTSNGYHYGKVTEVDAGAAGTKKYQEVLDQYNRLVGYVEVGGNPDLILDSIPKFTDSTQTYGNQHTVNGVTYQEVKDKSGKIIGYSQVGGDGSILPSLPSGGGGGAPSTAPNGAKIKYEDGRAYYEFPDGRREWAPEYDLSGSGGNNFIPTGNLARLLQGNPNAQGAAGPGTPSEGGTQAPANAIGEYAGNPIFSQQDILNAAGTPGLQNGEPLQYGIPDWLTPGQNNPLPITLGGLAEGGGVTPIGPTIGSNSPQFSGATEFPTGVGTGHGIGVGFDPNQILAAAGIQSTGDLAVDTNLALQLMNMQETGIQSGGTTYGYNELTAPRKFGESSQVYKKRQALLKQSVSPGSLTAEEQVLVDPRGPYSNPGGYTYDYNQSTYQQLADQGLTPDEIQRYFENQMADGGTMTTSGPVGMFRLDPMTGMPAERVPSAIAGEAGPERITVKPLRPKMMARGGSVDAGVPRRSAVPYTDEEKQQIARSEAAKQQEQARIAAKPPGMVPQYSVGNTTYLGPPQVSGIPVSMPEGAGIPGAVNTSTAGGYQARPVRPGAQAAAYTVRSALMGNQRIRPRRPGMG